MILVVDDEARVRSVAVDLLRHEGYEVVEAENGGTALEALKANPDIELMLTDIMMPTGSGISLGQRAAAAFPGLRVVYVSAYDESLGFRRSQLNGALLPKPYRARELLDTVERALAG